MANRSMTRLDALDFAIEAISSVAGAAEVNYAKECFEAVEVLERMRHAMIKERDLKLYKRILAKMQKEVKRAKNKGQPQ